MQLWIVDSDCTTWWLVRRADCGVLTSISSMDYAGSAELQKSKDAHTYADTAGDRPHIVPNACSELRVSLGAAKLPYSRLVAPASPHACLHASPLVLQLHRAPACASPYTKRARPTPSHLLAASASCTHRSSQGRLRASAAAACRPTAHSASGARAVRHQAVRHRALGRGQARATCT